MKKSVFVAFVVSLGGFLFGFDAGIISGVMSYAGPEFNLSDTQLGWAVSSPSFSAMFAMLVAGRLSDVIGRRKILIGVAFLYALSAILSALANGFEMLYIARMIGGLAFGAALVIAPTYIAEISSADSRGTLVSIQQLNIVLGFFAAFLSNYFFNLYNTSDITFLTDQNVWRWMLGVETLPAIVYFVLLFFVPKSPRWLYTNKRNDEALSILKIMHGNKKALKESKVILNNLAKTIDKPAVKIQSLFQPSLKFVIILGLILGIIQQITGINAIYFYATSIFKQTGIGTDAAFASGVLLSLTTVIFTVIAMFFIDKVGRRPLMLIGLAGIAISLSLCAYGFNNATYKLTTNNIKELSFLEKNKLSSIVNKEFTSDIAFKNEMKIILGKQVYRKNDGAILALATTMNSTIVLIGILGFIACFAFSLGPVMWVMLSELFPNNIRGLAIGFIGFVNGFASWLVQQIFPWELSNLGNAMSFFIFAVIALLGFIVLLKILPETKGKSLEQIEEDLVKN